MRNQQTGPAAPASWQSNSLQARRPAPHCLVKRAALVQPPLLLHAPLQPAQRGDLQSVVQWAMGEAGKFGRGHQRRRALWGGGGNGRHFPQDQHNSAVLLSVLAPTLPSTMTRRRRSSWSRACARSCFCCSGGIASTCSHTCSDAAVGTIADVHELQHRQGTHESQALVSGSPSHTAHRRRGCCSSWRCSSASWQRHASAAGAPPPRVLPAGRVRGKHDTVAASRWLCSCVQKPGRGCLQ